MYPYHMPGHKRRLSASMPPEYIRADITEIDGFDNLHDSKGILLELQKKAAMLYGADESFFLVNGSSCGVLAAISAAVSEGGHIIMARNSHKSAYHAAYLRKLKIAYLYPEQIRDYEINEAVRAEQVREALRSCPQAEAVFLVSPTYEGRIADVAEIAKLVHEQNKILIVDEAHGAHLGFAEGFAENSIQAGADLVIHSVHKTLPAPTQTALLHVNGERVNRELVRRFLRIYQSSSPSYLLMAGIADALNVVEKQGKELFPRFLARWRKMLVALEQCKVLRFLPIDAPLGQDIGKLVIETSRTNHSGLWLYDILRERYHLQPEMAAGNYCLAMFTVADTEEGYQRLTKALLEIDKELTQMSYKCNVWHKNTGIPAPETVIPLHSAWDMPRKRVLLSKAIGKIAAEFVNLYPPGTPILVPGERITEELCDRIREDCEKGLNVQGVEQNEDGIWMNCIE